MNKTMIAAAALGLAISGASVATAQASPLNNVGTGSSRAGLRGCPKPPSVDSLTSLALHKTTVHRGDSNTATAKVTSAGAANPEGSIELAIYQSQSGLGYGKKLRDGQVKFPMPENLSVGRYSVRASYLPAECSKWRKSRSRVLHLTVLAK